MGFVKLDNGQIMEEKILNTSTQEVAFQTPIGMEFETEQIKDEEGNVTGTITKKFNLELGEYEIV